MNKKISIVLTCLAFLIGCAAQQPAVQTKIQFSNPYFDIYLADGWVETHENYKDAFHVKYTKEDVRLAALAGRISEEKRPFFKKLDEKSASLMVRELLIASKIQVVPDTMTTRLVEIDQNTAIHSRLLIDVDGEKGVYHHITIFSSGYGYYYHFDVLAPHENSVAKEAIDAIYGIELKGGV